MSPRVLHVALLHSVTEGVGWARVLGTHSLSPPSFPCPCVFVCVCLYAYTYMYVYLGTGMLVWE